MEKYFEKRKSYVSDFIKSYLLYKQLEEVSGFDENRDFTTSIKPVDMNPFDEELAEGQIRLLSQTERITYVALLKRWGNDAFVVMPFSRFSYPATNEEVKTDFDGGLYLQVLQAWNTRTLQDESLRKSWCIGSLSQKDLTSAWNLWKSTISGNEPDDSILQNTALPIYHENDPRLDYKQEELENFARLDAEDLAIMEKSAFFLWSDQDDEKGILPIAAGGEKDNLQFTFMVDSPAATIFIEYSQHDKMLCFDVYGADGNPSTVLDSCMVIDNSDGTILGTIQDGILKIAYDSPECSISFLKSDGTGMAGVMKSENSNE